MSIRFGRAIQGAAALAVASSIVAACSSAPAATTAAGVDGVPAGQSETAPAVSPGTSMTASAGATGATGTTTGHVGDTLTFSNLGDQIDVTLVALIDPATVASPSSAAPAGSRWVGLKMTINDHETAPNTDSIAADGVGSDGQRYGFNTAYSIGAFNECTPTVNDAAAGQTATFCTGFMVPTNVAVTSVGYSVAGADYGADDNVTWKVP